MSDSGSNQTIGQGPRFLADDFDPKLKHLSVSFLRRLADSSDITTDSLVDVPESGVVFLLGKNGSGKSRFIDGLNALTKFEICEFPSMSLIFEIPNIDTQLLFIEDLEKIKQEPWLADFIKTTKVDRWGNEFCELSLTDVLLDSFIASSKTSASSFGFGIPWPEKGEHLLAHFGADPGDYRDWKDREYLYYQKSDPFHPEWVDAKETVREKYVLGEHFLDFIVASMSQSYVHYNDGQYSPAAFVHGSEWWEDKSKRALVFSALKELIEGATHIRVKVDHSFTTGVNLQFELLAKKLQHGAINELLSSRTISNPVWVNESDPTDRRTFSTGPYAHQDSFPFDMVQVVDFLGEKYVKSISIPIAKSILDEKRDGNRHHLWSLIGLTVFDISGDREDEAKQLQNRVWGLTRTSRIVNQDPQIVTETFEEETVDSYAKDSFVLRITGLDRVNSFYKEISEQISKCDIGISALKGMEPNPIALSAPNQFELAPTIIFQDAETHEWLPITKASQGQFDTILFLCRLQLSGFERSAVRIMVADEFDKHLHPTAAIKVLEIVQQYCLEKKILTFISTHSLSQYLSPGIRGLPRIFFDRNVTGDICLTSRSSADPLLVAEVLGTTELDAYLLKNLYVMVEGEHEILIFNDLLKSEGRILEDIRIFSSAGTYGFHGIWETLRLLHSPVLVIYDKKSEALELAWKQIQIAAVDLKNKLNLWNDYGIKKIYFEVEKRVNQHPRIPGDTELWSLLKFLKLVLNSEDCRRNISRVFLHGIEYDDIVDALPIKHFVGDRFKSWDDARMQYNADSRKFKKIMSINEGSIKRAIAETNLHKDPELLKVKNKVIELSQRTAYMSMD